MAMSAAQIAQELEALEAKTAEGAEQAYQLYGRYLKELGQAASQQLMSVCYELCTRENPEAFLNLSQSDRQALQAKVREQGEQLQEQLSLEGLLQPDPDSLDETAPTQVAVIKAELNSDDLVKITRALDDDDSDRLVALLKERAVDLPLELEEILSGESVTLVSDSTIAKKLSQLDEQRPDGSRPEEQSSDEQPANQQPADEEQPEEQQQTGTESADSPLPASDSPSQPLEGEAKTLGQAIDDSPKEGTGVNQNVANQGLDPSPSGEAAPDLKAPSTPDAELSSPDLPVASASRNWRQRFMDNFRSPPAPAVEAPSAGAAVTGTSAQAESREEASAQGDDVTDGERPRIKADEELKAEEVEASGETTASMADDEMLPAELTQDDEAYDEHNGFDPDFEPPPAEDRYVPPSSKQKETVAALSNASRLDISPGVLASALAAEGEAERAGVALVRPTSPYDGTTDLSPEARRDPKELMRWAERMERGISQRLRQSSQHMTRTLEKFSILNNHLPEGLLEAASRPGGDHEQDSNQKAPHILSLKLNATGKDKRSKGKPIRITAIYLRLGELEFATPAVMAWRNQLRLHGKQLQQLNQAYQKQRHNQSVVEAQMLWRQDWGKD